MKDVNDCTITINFKIITALKKKGVREFNL